MNKRTLRLALALMLALMVMGCGGRKQAETGVADQDSATSIADLAEPATPAEYYLTADSIGPVHVGEMISALQPHVPGLYDMMITTETPDAMAYTFMLGDIPQFTIYDFMEGNVDVIALEGEARAVDTPSGPLRVGDEFSRVLALPGVESDWQNMDDTGVWYWKWNGLYFGVEETGLDDTLTAALTEGRRPPRAADFNADVKIGYIATGLPF